MIQRTLAFLLCAVMLFSLISCQQNSGASKEPSAPETTSPPPSPIEDFEYRVSSMSEEMKQVLEGGHKNGLYSDEHVEIMLSTEGLICITKYVGTDINVVIPSEIDGIPVYGVGMEAFVDTQVETVWLPDSLQIIGERAFYEHPTLTAVYGGSGLRMIGKEAFTNCRELTTIDLSSDTLHIILNRAFRGCIKLTGLELSSQLAEIGNQAFAGCISIQSVTIPKTLTKWRGDECFAACRALSSVTFEEGVTSIRGYNFYINDAIKTLTIPASVKEIEDTTLFSDSFTALTEIIFKGNAPTITISEYYPLSPSDLVIYYDPNTEGWDTTPLKDYFTLVPIN